MSTPRIVRLDVEGFSYRGLECPLRPRDALPYLCGKDALVKVQKRFWGNDGVDIYRVRHALTGSVEKLRISNESPRHLAENGFEIVDYSMDFYNVFWGFLFDNRYKTKIRPAQDLVIAVQEIEHSFTEQQLLWLIDTCRSHWGMAITGWPILRGDSTTSPPFDTELVGPLNSVIAELVGGLELLICQKNFFSFLLHHAPTKTPIELTNLLETKEIVRATELGYYPIGTDVLRKLVKSCVETMRYDLLYRE